MTDNINHNMLGNRAYDWATSTKELLARADIEIDWSLFPEKEELEKSHKAIVDALKNHHDLLMELSYTHYEIHDNKNANSNT